jgi:integrase
MGRTGSGVEVREKSIRLSFTFEGKQHRHTLTLNGAPLAPTAANVRYAHRLAIEIRERIRHGTFSLVEYFPASGASPTGTTVGSQLDTWLGTLRVEHSTKAGYSSAMRFWKAAPCDELGSPLGDLQLRKVKLSHLLTALASRPDLSGKTVNNYVCVLRDALQLAVDDKVLPENPAAGVPKAKHQKEPPDPFSADEAEAILADMAKHYPEQVGNLTEWWFFTGVRTSEMAGLQWPSIDLAAGRMRVHEGIVRGKAKDTTKTAVSRDVILNSRALAALQRQAKHTRMRGTHVWLEPVHGTTWSPESVFVTKYWAPTLKRLGIRYRRPYNMRHSYAARMLMAGMTPAFCARQLGHSVQMFCNTYAKWIDGQRDTLEMQRLEATLGAGVAPGAAQGL